MAKIKTFYHLIILENEDSLRESKNESRRESNLKKLDARDSEINEFIRDKKVININTTAKTDEIRYGSYTSGYITTILYED